MAQTSQTVGSPGLIPGQIDLQGLSLVKSWKWLWSTYLTWYGLGLDHALSIRATYSAGTQIYWFLRHLSMTLCTESTPSVCAPTPGTSGWLPSSSLWETSEEYCWAQNCGFGTHNHHSTKCTPHAPYAQRGNRWHWMQTHWQTELPHLHARHSGVVCRHVTNCEVVDGEVCLAVQSWRVQSGAEEEDHSLFISMAFFLLFFNTGLFLSKKMILPLTLLQVSSLEGAAGVALVLLWMVKTQVLLLKSFCEHLSR